MLALAGLALLAALIVLALYRSLEPATQPRPIVYGYGPANFAEAIAMNARHIALGEQRVRDAPDQWSSQESLAQALLARARLTGSFDDLARAQAALESGMATAQPGAGPLLTAAVGNMTVHRLPPVAALLDTLGRAAVPADVDERAEAMAIAGDLQFYTGHYAAAKATYTAAAGLHHDAGIAIRLANWYQKMGDPAAALAQIDAAMASTRAPTRPFHANLLLQKGSIQLTSGDWLGAEASFAAADKVFPGNWRAAAFLAQMRAARGDTGAALAAYTAIPDPPPEVMDAIAATYRSTGDTAASRRWADRATLGWARRMAQLPEAAVGHALEHALVFGTPDRALALAQQNYDARPYGDGLVMLGWAQLQAGDPAAAAATIARVNASGWRSPQQYLVLADAAALLGDPDAAESARAQALALNQRALDPAVSLLWFGNH